ncbi:MAG: OmpA family protein, partial [Flavobacteriales bacterium]|nr:OmpA family protein [Flavobacteriales bacterium]
MSVGFCATAQSLDKASTRQLRKFRVGALREKAHYTSWMVMTELTHRRPKKIAWQVELAEACFALRDYGRAKNILLPVVQQYGDQYPQVYPMLFRVYEAFGVIDSAAVFLEKAKGHKKGPAADIPIRKWHKNKKNSLLLQSTPDTSTSRPSISHLPQDINRPNIEFSPMPIGGDTLMFGSLAADSSVVSTATDTLRRQIFTAVRFEKYWKNIGESNILNDIPEGLQPGSFCQSENAVLTIAAFCKYNWKYEVVCQLYYRGHEQTWTKLPSPVNKRRYTQTQPWLAATSRGKMILYFVSNRKGGKGGTDIWYTRFDPNKMEFELPRNAGSKINTFGDEYTPRYATDMKKLYFSSDGHPGYGGLDVFYAIGERSRWSVAQNAGRPINSTFDDLFFTQANSSGGFFTSNRKGVAAQHSPHCCDDLFTYTNNKNSHARIELLIAEGVEPTPLKKVSVQIIVIEPTEGEHVFLGEFPADSLGKFYRLFEDGFKYKLIFKHEGFYNADLIVDLYSKQPPPDVITDTIKMRKWTKEEIVLPNINFEYNSAKLAEDAMLTLDTGILKIMRENPHLRIEIGAHTDHNGSENYNKNLSRQRAESVVKYLVNRGISAKRLSAIGYGESRPIAPNTHPDGRDYPAGRAQNRRTTFRI